MQKVRVEDTVPNTTSAPGTKKTLMEREVKVANELPAFEQEENMEQSHND